MQKSLASLALILSFASSATFAQTSRPTWVVNDIYNYNHPYAATDSTDLAIKMQTMNSSAFYFYRGTADIFYHDMSTLPASDYVNATTNYTWLGGDTHIANFGAFQDSSGNTVFGVDDFDEGYLGQYVWDLRRTATSIVLAGQENGLSTSDITTAINTFVGAYLAELNVFVSSNKTEKSFQLTSSNTSSVVQSTISTSADDSRSSLLSKYTSTPNGVRSFQTTSDLATVSSGTYSAIVSAVSAYVQTISASKQYPAGYYTVKDVRQRFGEGTGSLGKLRYYVLVEGPTTSDSDDVILDLKQEATSNVAIVDPGQLPVTDYASNEGDRVARTNKAQLINAAVLIGYTTINGIPYYVEEKSPYAEDFDYTQLTSSKKFNTAMTYFGQALASAHALSDNDYDSTVVPYSIETQITKAVTSNSGLESEISAFAFSYATQVNLDWQAFQSAYAAGTPLY
jgi:uncharacterized protein (DUF2252 family)